MTSGAIQQGVPTKVKRGAFTLAEVGMLEVSYNQLLTPKSMVKDLVKWIRECVSIHVPKKRRTYESHQAPTVWVLYWGIPWWFVYVCVCVYTCLASFPGHSQLFNVTREKREGLVHVSKFTCVTLPVERPTGTYLREERVKGHALTFWMFLWPTVNK